MDAALESRVKTTLGPGKFKEFFPEFALVDDISDIQTDRLPGTIEAKGLRVQSFYTGNTGNYRLEGGDVVLYVADFANHPARKGSNGRKDFVGFAQDLHSNENFFPDKDTYEGLEGKAASGDDVVRVNLSELGPILQGSINNQWGCIEIPIELLVKGKEQFGQYYGNQYGREVAVELIKLFDATHGQAIYGQDGIAAALPLFKEGKTNIRVLYPRYVEGKLEGKEKGTMLSRASGLLGFDDLSNVSLYCRGLDLHVFVRGVVEAAEGRGAQNVMPYEDAVNEGARIAPPETPFHPIIINLINAIYGK